MSLPSSSAYFLIPWSPPFLWPSSFPPPHLCQIDIRRAKDEAVSTGSNTKHLQHEESGFVICWHQAVITITSMFAAAQRILFVPRNKSISSLRSCVTASFQPSFEDRSSLPLRSRETSRESRRLRMVDCNTSTNCQ